MIKFIIIDDEEKTAERIRKIIIKALFKYDLSYVTEIFPKYDKDLQKEIKDDSIIKIYIMDIELANSISGIEIAEKIRENDWESNIIFITSHDKMFETVYRNIYNIFDFIEKFENMDKRLEKDIINIAKHNFDNKTFKYSCRNVDIQIYLKSINYITRDTKERKLIINTDNNDFEVNISITDILKKLDERFLQVSRSTLINKDNVSEINWNKGFFILKNGDIKYLVSKNYKRVK
jgi:two-component system, LytTR family, response regulator AgrA